MTTGPAPTSSSRRASAVGAWSLALLLVVTPWPLGSRLAWADTWAATVMLVLTGTWLGIHLLWNDPPRVPAVAIPIAAFLALALWQWLAAASVDPFATSQGLRSRAAYAVVFLAAMTVGRRGAVRRGLVRVILAVGLCVAVFALMQRLTWNGKIFWVYEPPMGGSSPFGPFNNRNAFAGYMLATIGPSFGLLVAATNARWRKAAAMLAIVGSAAVIVSLSRGGMVGLLAAAVAAAGLGAALGPAAGGTRTRRRWLNRVLLLAVALMFGLLLAYWMGQADAVMARLGTFLNLSAERSAEGRLTIWTDTLKMIAARPFLGFGLNAFVWGHLAFRSSTTGIPQHAHNEYLEIVATTGLIGGAICVWFLWWLGATVLRELRNSPPGFETGLRLGAAASWIGIMAYSLTDFPTVIPATDYVLAILAGLACVQVSQPTRTVY